MLHNLLVVPLFHQPTTMLFKCFYAEHIVLLPLRLLLRCLLSTVNNNQKKSKRKKHPLLRNLFNLKSNVNVVSYLTLLLMILLLCLLLQSQFLKRSMPLVLKLSQIIVLLLLHPSKKPHQNLILLQSAGAPNVSDVLQSCLLALSKTISSRLMMIVLVVVMLSAHLAKNEPNTRQREKEKNANLYNNHNLLHLCFQNILLLLRLPMMLLKQQRATLCQNILHLLSL
mmetsp:Transcript_2287/g.3296  ORF Transcript_2287/g.3296 Transcript_2287/m.3296 type:complete len:226 (+) Transcript_2287:688-1365(+)